MNERVKLLKEESIKSCPEIFPFRSLSITESYKETEGMPMAIRRAMALNKILSEIPIIIRDHELIVGAKTLKPRGSPIYPEIYCWTEEDLNSVCTRKEAPYFVSDETKKILLEKVFPYWKGKTTNDLIMENMTTEWKKAVNGFAFTEYMLSRAPGHTICQYEKILEKGFKGMKADIEYSLTNLDYANREIFKKINELKAMRISCDAAILFAKRHAQEARRLAKEEKNKKRKRELLTIANVCERIPENPARNFWEAIQSFWFTHLILTLETSAWAFAPGRFDQYIYPCFNKDIQEEKINKEEGKELLECLWVKFNNTVAPPKDIKTAKGSATYNDFYLVNLAGQTKDGKDATNELSYLILDVTKDMRLTQPSPLVLLSNKTPESFLLKSCDVIREGFGQPAMFNDENKIEVMLREGKTLEDARLGGINGCVTPNARKENMASTGYANWPKYLELALNNGVDPVTGEQLGIKSGDPLKFKSFDDLSNAYKKQIQYFVDVKIQGNNIIERLYADFCPVPYTSILIDDCIEKALDYHDGGAHYSNLSFIQGVGLGTTTDSLVAIKKMVFDDKKITMRELLEALKNNFKDEKLYLWVLNKIPKYGNNDDYADSVAYDMVTIYLDCFKGKHTSKGGRYAVNLLPTTVHVPMGAVCGATPDGRKAGEPLSEGVSPVQGADHNGPTAVINSVAKIDHTRLYGTLLNQKFHPSILKGDDNLKKFAKYIRSYFSMMGHHVQFNVISIDTLKKAQKNPEKYRNLIIRVAGYSDYFINLNSDLQNEIIARTEQVEMG